MTRRAALLLLLVLVTTSSLLAQRNPLKPSTPDGDDNSSTEIVVHVIFPSEDHAGEHITVLLESANGGTVAQAFTNDEGVASFLGVRHGSYTIRVRGLSIKETVTGVLNFESFETTRHEYIRAQALDPNSGTRTAQGTVGATELKVPEKARKEFDLGNEALSGGKTDEAVQHFQKAVALFPQFSLAYNNLAASYMKTSDFIHAREALQKALKADPGSSFTTANLIRLTLLQHDYAEAIAESEKALQRDPNNTEFLFLMCEAQFFAGKLDQAVSYARKVYVAPHEKFEMAHIYAGRALEAQHRLEEAKREYLALVEESPFAAEASEASRSLMLLHRAAKKQ